MADIPVFHHLTIAGARQAFATAAMAVMDEREARATARIALEAVTRLSQVDMAIKASEEVTDYQADKLAEICGRVLSREPIQYILGEAYWCGMKLRVNPDTLIPRPETQQLVDLIVNREKGADLRMLDVGTGSGCIAIALARGLKFSEVTAIDYSAGALEVARDNAKSLRANVDFVQADALNLPPEPEPIYDIIVSNPPYIPWEERSAMEANVLDYEPSSALFVPDADPTLFYDAIMRYAATALKPGGRVYFEINPRFVARLRQSADKELPGAKVEFLRDMYGRYRFMIIVTSVKPRW